MYSCLYIWRLRDRCREIDVGRERKREREKERMEERKEYAYEKECNVMNGITLPLGLHKDPGSLLESPSQFRKKLK